MRLVAPSDWGATLPTQRLYYLTAAGFDIRTVHELGPEGTPIRAFQHTVSDPVRDCWASGRLRPGDILLCDVLGGDGMYDWFLITYVKYADRPGVHMTLVPHPFRAPALQAVVLNGFTERDYRFLMAGREVEVLVELPK